MPLFLKNQEIHRAIFQLQIALARAGGRGGSLSVIKAKIRIVFADRAECSIITRAVMQEVAPHEVLLQHPPRFHICGADVALLTVLTEDR